MKWKMTVIRQNHLIRTIRTLLYIFLFFSCSWVNFVLEKSKTCHFINRGAQFCTAEQTLLAAYESLKINEDWCHSIRQICLLNSQFKNNKRSSKNRYYNNIFLVPFNMVFAEFYRRWSKLNSFSSCTSFMIQLGYFLFFTNSMNSMNGF